MNIIYRPRQSGKTIELIKISAAKQIYIVTFNRKEADRIYDIAHNIGYKIPYPISIDQLLSGKHKQLKNREFLFDNADIILQNIFSDVKIHTITLSQPEPINKIDLIKSVIPKNKDFRISEIVNKIYPESISIDRSGRTFNRASATLARLLRKMRGVIEPEHCIFYADEEAVKYF